MEGLFSFYMLSHFFNHSHLISPMSNAIYKPSFKLYIMIFLLILVVDLLSTHSNSQQHKPAGRKTSLHVLPSHSKVTLIVKLTCHSVLKWLGENEKCFVT
jgi:hypothetical protein